MTNQYLGPNSMVEDSTVTALESLGFDTTGTYMVDQDMFSVTINDLIPTVPYSDCVTWTKYGCNLFPSADCITDNYEMMKGMRTMMVEFLRTDICGMTGSALPERIIELISQEIVQVDVNFSNPEIEAVVKGFSEMIKEEAKKMTTLPLSVLTYLCRERFKKHVFFESSLEVLQWFEVKLVDDPGTYRNFVGDMFSTILCCRKCGMAITSPKNLCATLALAP